MGPAVFAWWMGGVAVAAPLWSWSETTPRRYYLEAHGLQPRLSRLHGPDGRQVRYVEYEVALVVDCLTVWGERAGREQVYCTVVDAGLRLDPVVGDLEHLAPVMAAVEPAVVGATLSLRFRDDGRLTRARLLESPSLSRNTHQDVENLLLRAVAGLDLRQTGAADWSDAMSMTAQVVPRVQVEARLAHTAEPGRHPDTVVVETSGRVVLDSPALSPDGTLLRTGASVPATQASMGGTTGGVALWDLRAQELVARQWWVSIDSGSFMRTYVEGKPVRHPHAAVQSGLVLRIPEGKAAPAVGPWGAGGFERASVSRVEALLVDAGIDRGDAPTR